MPPGTCSAAILLVSMAGCTLDTRLLGGEDAGPIPDGQMAERDSAPPPDDGGRMRDRPVPPGVDGGPPPPEVDGAPPPEPDSGPPPEPDGGPPPEPDGGPPPPRPCDVVYGGLTTFHVCRETATECELYVSLGGASCDAACATGGGRCLRTYRENEPDLCTYMEPDPRPCGSGRDDEICVCDHPP